MYVEFQSCIQKTTTASISKKIECSLLGKSRTSSVVSVLISTFHPKNSVACYVLPTGASMVALGLALSRLLGWHWANANTGVRIRRFREHT